jgi:hypothetical protein
MDTYLKLMEDATCEHITTVEQQELQTKPREKHPDCI